MSPRFVAVHGLKFAGKSMVAERLMERHGFVRVKMADPLKNMIRSLLRDAGVAADVIERCVEGDLKEAPLDVLCGHTTRHAMMTIGNEWRDLLSRDLWVRIAEARISSLLDAGQDVVVDDIRYPRELEILAPLRPARWVVTRGPLHFQPYGEDRHPSERPMAVELFDEHVANEHETLEPLWDHVDRLVEGFPGLLHQRDQAA